MATTNPAVHRDLELHQKGEDVKVLQRQADAWLKAHNQPHRFLSGAHDGEVGPKTLDAVARAAFMLGVTEQTHKAIVNGHIVQGVQCIVRRPKDRGDHQRARGRERMDAWRKDREQRIEEAKAHPHAALATEAMQLLLRHAAEAHYTMGSSRWQGINEKLKAHAGHFPDYSDCSSSYTWAWWQALGDGPDVLNGASWTGGYTGTLLSHGVRVSKGAEGVAALYGSGFPGKHVVYCLDENHGISQGSEAAPFYVDLSYRSDLMEYRSYV